MFIKIGEALEIQATDIQSVDNVLADAEIISRFEKIASEIKAIAPKAKDFLYFTAVMMHAAEASLLTDSGEFIKDASGNDVKAHWEKAGESWRWVCSDKNVKPYRNANRDIFPEEELIKAHKQWVGRPLCIDHKSDSVDHIRGVIVDTYYDLAKKRVVALCALDKKNYPDLARKVSSKYSTSVSMGTAVGCAICFDCGKVARAERDFCDCMRAKSCYGEINTDLKPIELSIVVNGADAKAKIKHVWAAANSLAQYIEMKENQSLSKVANQELVSPSEISSIKMELQSILDKLSDLEGQAEKQEETEEEATAEASTKEDFGKIAKVLDNLNNKVDFLKDQLEAKFKEDKYMTDKKAYFQGGGGVNEPTPGQPKYEKENYTAVRDGQDKQMVGQMETGPVDGMHPGYDSFGETEEARKKRLQRLAEEQTERALLRQAAVEKAKAQVSQKNAYFQGGGGDNEPTPGKVKYPAEDYKKVRDKEDKQMVGQAPFPGVGDVDGLHPSPASADVKDELKRKEMLSRAALKGRFFKAANSDGTESRGDSCWQVFADDKLILSATVNEISGNKADMFYDSIASKKFGQQILNTIKSKGYDEAKSILKGAQLSPEAAAPAAPVPMDMPAEMPGAEMEMPEGDMGMDAGGSGDPAEEVMELMTTLNGIEGELSKTLADMQSALEVMVQEPANELPGFDELAEEPKVAELKQLNKLQIKVASAISLGMKKAVASVKEQLDELSVVRKVLSSKIEDKNKKLATKLIKDAFADSRTLVGEVSELKQAFVNYVRGSESLEKRASNLRETMKKRAQMNAHDPLMGLDGDPIAMSEDEEDMSKYKAKPSFPQAAGTPAKKPLDRQPNLPGALPEGMSHEQEQSWLHGARGPARDELDQMLTSNTPAGQLGPEGHGTGTLGDGGPSMHKVPGDLNDLEMTLQDGTKITASADLTTKEGRAALRAKLAQKGLKFSDMLNQAHPGGGVTPGLEVKPTGDLAKVERLDETHSKMMDVATAPVKVRKQAEEIQSLVAKGALDPSEENFAALVAEGLDPAAVKYWKQFYGQASDGGSEFAAALVKSVNEKKAATESEVLHTKIARAWELTDEMVRRGMLADNREAKKGQVEELVKFEDVAFDHFKNFVEKQKTVKQASMPQVMGHTMASELYVPVPRAESGDSLKDELEKAFSTTTYKPRNF